MPRIPQEEMHDLTLVVLSTTKSSRSLRQEDLQLQISLGHLSRPYVKKIKQANKGKQKMKFLQEFFILLFVLFWVIAYSFWWEGRFARLHMKFMRAFL
jgi:hypothetical protein